MDWQRAKKRKKKEKKTERPLIIWPWTAFQVVFPLDARNKEEKRSFYICIASKRNAHKYTHTHHIRIHTNTRVIIPTRGFAFKNIFLKHALETFVRDKGKIVYYVESCLREQRIEFILSLSQHISVKDQVRFDLVPRFGQQILPIFRKRKHKKKKWYVGKKKAQKFTIYKRFPYDFIIRYK